LSQSGGISVLAALFVAHAAASARLPLFAQSSHATVVAPTGVKQ